MKEKRENSTKMSYGRMARNDHEQILPLPGPRPGPPVTKPDGTAAVLGRPRSFSSASSSSPLGPPKKKEALVPPSSSAEQAPTAKAKATSLRSSNLGTKTRSAPSGGVSGTSAAPSLKLEDDEETDEDEDDEKAAKEAKTAAAEASDSSLD